MTTRDMQTVGMLSFSCQASFTHTCEMSKLKKWRFDVSVSDVERNSFE